MQNITNEYHMAYSDLHVNHAIKSGHLDQVKDKLGVKKSYDYLAKKKLNQVRGKTVGEAADQLRISGAVEFAGAMNMINRDVIHQDMDIDTLVDYSNGADKDTFIMLIGNKSDLIDKRIVSKEEAQTKAEQYNIAFLETSAKNGDNIEKAFTELVEQIYKANISIQHNEEVIEESNGEGVNLENKEEKKKGCC